jgi:hypothetical protein
MIERLCLWAALLTIWALQTCLIILSVGATAQFSAKFAIWWLGGG